MQQFYLGDTIKLNATSHGYKNTEWSSVLILQRNDKSVSFNGVSSSEDQEMHQVSITPNQQTALISGVYKAYLRITKNGEVITLKLEPIVLYPDPIQNKESRTQLEQDLAAVEEAMRAVIGKGAVQRYRIQTNAGERELERMSLEELRSHHKWLRLQVNKERVAMGKKPLGGDQWQKVKFCMSPSHNHRRRRR